jgi:hypothetical protein
MLFGSACEYMANLTTIFILVKDQMAMFEQNQVAHLLWAVFTDARSYLSTPHHDQMGNPPASTLNWLIGAIRGRSLPETLLGTLLQSLLGGTSSPHSGNPYQLESQNSQPDEEQGGRTRYQLGLPEPNPNVNSRIKAATAEKHRGVLLRMWTFEW